MYIYIYCPKKRTHFGFRTALMKMFDPLQMLIMLCVCIYIYIYIYIHTHTIYFKNIFINIYLYLACIFIHKPRCLSNAYPDGPDWWYRMLFCDLDLSQVGNGGWCPSLGWMDYFVLECIEGRGSGRFDLFPERRPVACLQLFLLELWRNYIVWGHVI